MQVSGSINLAPAKGSYYNVLKHSVRVKGVKHSNEDINEDLSKYNEAVGDLSLLGKEDQDFHAQVVPNSSHLPSYHDVVEKHFGAYIKGHDASCRSSRRYLNVENYLNSTKGGAGAEESEMVATFGNYEQLQELKKKAKKSFAEQHQDLTGDDLDKEFQDKFLKTESDALIKYARGFNQRNKQFLKCVSAVTNVDEKGAPHVHMRVLHCGTTKKGTPSKSLNTALSELYPHSDRTNLWKKFNEDEGKAVVKAVGTAINREFDLGHHFYRGKGDDTLVNATAQEYKEIKKKGIDVTSLETARDAYRQQTVLLNKKNKDLMDKNEQLTTESSENKAENAKLKQENAKLKQENETLKQRQVISTHENQIEHENAVVSDIQHVYGKNEYTKKEHVLNKDQDGRITSYNIPKNDQYRITYKGVVMKDPTHFNRELTEEVKPSLWEIVREKITDKIHQMQVQAYQKIDCRVRKWLHLQGDSVRDLYGKNAYTTDEHCLDFDPATQSLKGYRVPKLDKMQVETDPGNPRFGQMQIKPEFEQFDPQNQEEIPADKWSEHVSGLKKIIEDHQQKRLEKTQKELAEAQKTKDQTDQAVLDLQAKVDQLNDKVHNTQQNLNAQDKEINSNNATISEQQREIRKNDEDIKRQKETLEKALQSVHNFEKRQEALQRQEQAFNTGVDNMAQWLCSTPKYQGSDPQRISQSLRDFLVSGNVNDLVDTINQGIKSSIDKEMKQYDSPRSKESPKETFSTFTGYRQPFGGLGSTPTRPAKPKSRHRDDDELEF